MMKTLIVETDHGGQQMLHINMIAKRAESSAVLRPLIPSSVQVTKEIFQLHSNTIIYLVLSPFSELIITVQKCSLPRP